MNYQIWTLICITVHFIGLHKMNCALCPFLDILKRPLYCKKLKVSIPDIATPACAQGSRKTMIIAVDFDGTCVEHKYPNIGEDIGAVPVLKKIVNAGHSIVLFTMRSGKGLEEAKHWFLEHGIGLDGVQKAPGQDAWTDSPKCYANIYIDDAALGAPLKGFAGARPYIDWNRVEELLTLMKVI
jgi:hypothetical protein